jgi:RNA polymerase sigma factor (sigma-70 family)
MANAGGNAFHQQIDRLFQGGPVSGLTDAELLERYLTRRDEVAFEALVRLHGPMVLGLCRRLLRDRQDVDDAFQATFLILVRKAPSLRDRTLLANWLYGVAYRVAIRLRKKTARRDAGKQPSNRLDEIADDRAKPAEYTDWLPILDQELTRIPEKYRGPLVLCYLNGQTHEQSAGRLGIPVGTVRSRLARGRDLLKRRLERRGVAPSVVAIALDKSPGTVAFVAKVPASLVTGTLVNTGQFLSISSVPTAATTATISAISLAQGVISAMFFSQLKVAGLGLLATAVVAGGVAQGVRAVDARPADQAGSKPAETPAPTIAGKPSSPQTEPHEVIPKEKSPLLIGQEHLEARIKELESKLDRLASQVPREPRRTDDERSRRGAPMLDLTGFKAQAGMSLPELAAEIQILKRRLASDRELIKFEQASAKSNIDNEAAIRRIMAATQQFNETRGSILRLIAKLERLKLDLEDERATLKYEVRRKMAERSVEQANVDIALTKVARNERLNQRIKGAVSEEDMAKDESVHKFADAQKMVVDTDFEFLVVRSRKLEFPMKKVDELLAEAKAIDLSENTTPAEAR